MENNDKKEYRNYAEEYYGRCAAAYVRGRAMRTGVPSLAAELMEKELQDLTEDEINLILHHGRKAEIKLYGFKRSHEDLPRVRRTLGFLKSLSFASLLDVGSGRGVFLFPFLDAFPWVQVTAVDVLARRVEAMQDLKRGGMDAFQVMEADICRQPFPDRSVDVVTMLEVLEHIPDVGAAVKAAVRMAKKHVVVTVPSKEDDNPEHIHLLTKEKLTILFQEAGCTRLRFDGVPGHLFLVVTID